MTARLFRRAAICKYEVHGKDVNTEKGTGVSDMTNEEKQDFMLRISQANKSGLVVILYDMFLTYIKDAKACEPKSAELCTSIRNSRNVLSELIDSLHMEYDIAKSTCELYRYVAVMLRVLTMRRA